jgi:hypothetical protein
VTSLNICSQMLKPLAALVIGLLVLSTHSYADTDPRMLVEVAADEQGAVPSVQDAIQQALPTLWDRVVEDSARALLADNIKATQFLSRVVPRSDGVQVTFNQDRVWQYLEQRQIAYLKEAPHISLQIRMTNQNGSDMPQTANALRAHAEGIALQRGIVMDHTAPALIGTWRWLDGSQVFLNVRGTAVEEFSETRAMKAGDPLVQLQAWVEEVLLKVRDVKTPEVEPIAIVTDIYAQTTEVAETSEPEFILTLESSAHLPAQVIFEDALRQNAHVKSITPTYLSATRRQYHILLNDRDDTWVPHWFQRRGMQALPTPEGWQVQ